MAGFLSKLFGGGGSDPAPAAEPIEYEGFTITPDPTKVSDGYRIHAFIEKDGRRHEMIRADTLRDLDGAVEATVMKARQMIDQMGDRIF